MKEAGNKRRQWQYTHTQVPFTTRSGRTVTCDEGMFEILTLLKGMGVETHFSCQGDAHGTYICAFTPGMQRVITKVVELHDLGWLSEQSMQFVSDWRTKGYRELTPMMGTGKYYQQINPRAKRKAQYFAHERELNGVYGDRTTVRCPKHRRHELLQLLIETQPHI